ncbi:hypothetical protein PAMC26577_22795 [Caballeronia sordidicola]|uniref:Uncharacterized protein n=1 Tax=Caballeronia sordidicola TaxID=196367 RepID=A0A242MKG8_CABSO|nr:hypothetical protein PAMC26577_22795 [Caballeronia sordidicola]
MTGVQRCVSRGIGGERKRAVCAGQEKIRSNPEPYASAHALSRGPNPATSCGPRSNLCILTHLRRRTECSTEYQHPKP